MQSVTYSRTSGLAHCVLKLNCVSLLACVVVCMGLSTGCFFSPPIESTPAEINQPPFIDPDRLLPGEEVITVTSSREIVLEATQLFDPNQESFLFYAWIAEGGWLSQNARTPFAADQGELYRGLYYRYDGVSLAFNPCNPNVRDKASETIFLYVSDRSFVEVTNTSVTPEDGAYLDIWAWVFQIQPGVCAE